ncbi:MAG: AgmX/PglI C-terminal domain-containing protein [Myxococcota bacterium]
MAEALTAAQRPLRVALLWNETIQEDELLFEPGMVQLGPGGMFPLPDEVAVDPVTVLVPQGNGYALQANGKLGGDVWIGGQRQRVSQLQGNIALGPSDYGVVTVGPVALFFQHVRGAAPAPRKMFDFDMSVVFAVLLSAFLAGVVMIIGYFDWVRHGAGEVDPFELDTELISRFMVTPPPEDLFDQMESGTETEDPGLETRDDTGGERHEGEEGRVGEENAAQEDTFIEGEVTDRIATKVRNMGLLGALSGGGEGNAIAAALDVPSVSDILGGMGEGVTVAGRGSGGAGLLGVGGGGGGDGPGALFGAGNVGTGQGRGRGGLGMGMGGVGARGRKSREVMVSVTRGMARVNGYLSAEQINRVVRANQAAVRYCYEVEVQRQPNLRGRVEINWRINLQGAVTSSRVARSTLRNPRVEGCIVRQVRRWRFPRPDGGEVNVTYPFIFGVQGG